MADEPSSLANRLSAFFSSNTPSTHGQTSVHPSSEPASRRRSLDTEQMKISRTRPPTPNVLIPTPRNTLAGPSRRPAHHSPKSRSIALPSDATKPQAQHPLPVLRWLTGKSKAAGRSPTNTSRPSTPVNSTPPSPSVYSALEDALHDDPHLLEARTVDLPSRPQAARLPQAFHAARPANYLTQLSRATLPTAYLLSPPPTTSVFQTTYTDPFADPFPALDYNPDLDLLYSPTPTPLAMPHSPARAHLNKSPPTLSTSPARSSIDSLRSIQEKGRGIHTTPSVQRLSLPAFPDSLKGWFTTQEGPSKEIVASPTGEETIPKSPSQIPYVAPKNPVVFCHGLLGFDTVTLGPSIAPLQVTHWRGIKSALEANGVEVLITRVPATSSPVDRAKVLEEKINEAYPGRSVHLIGHSMGGIDCRYLTTHLKDRKFKVLSVTTISSPHRGSSFADHFIATVGPERMPSVLSLLDLLPNGGGDGKAFTFLTVENMKKFNADTPDVEGVKYFSWGATYEPGLIDTWKWPHSVVLEKEGPNDGLVSLKSARWGTYLGTLEGVNHLDLVGWVNTARYKWAEIMGREIKFKPATFYLSIADHLARVVEGQQEEHLEPSDTVSADEQAEIRDEGLRTKFMTCDTLVAFIYPAHSTF
ncbi:GPI inositol-deacylase [Abortiporus biennis]